MKLIKLSKPEPQAEPLVIDMTPTWRGILPILLAALEDGTPEGKRIAREEIQRMADAADLWNARNAERESEA